MGRAPATGAVEHTPITRMRSPRYPGDEMLVKASFQLYLPSGISPYLKNGRRLRWRSSLRFISQH